MLVYKQIKANTPALMCSVPGYDASGWVDDLAAEMGKQLTSIAIGMIIDAMDFSMYNIYIAFNYLYCLYFECIIYDSISVCFIILHEKVLQR